LLALERIASAIEAHFGIEIEVYGFDSGKGMPAPIDYRDLPYVWEAGFYEMDRPALEAKLKHRGRLMLGSVEDRLRNFMPRHPVGFIAFDLDYYSSTVQAFRVFEAEHLPRVFCYFDDVIWPEWAYHNEYTGELAAIREFNKSHEAKICKINGLSSVRLRRAAWNEAMYCYHDFQHPYYCINLAAPEHRQIR
jgi:hypothetical protein